jgi:hypothetical protein
MDYVHSFIENYTHFCHIRDRTRRKKCQYFRNWHRNVEEHEGIGPDARLEEANSY